MLSVYQVSFYQLLGYVYSSKSRVFKGFFGTSLFKNTYHGTYNYPDSFRIILSRKGLCLWPMYLWAKVESL